MSFNEERVSKYMSSILRHNIEKIGMVLETGGWVSLPKFIENCNKGLQKNGFTLDLEMIKIVVANDKKGRYSISEDGEKIRANQGHSVSVDLGLKNVVPPPVLYHGTVENVLPLIKKSGLLPMNRHAVHLSKDVETANVVASRRKSKSFIITIDAKAMFADGCKFQCSSNGVWLTDHVNPRYFKEIVPVN